MKNRLPLSYLTRSSLLLVLLLTACLTNAVPTIEVGQTPLAGARVIVVTATPTPPLPLNVNPLTGLAADPASLDRRPIVVKISNAPAIVRPQAGIGSADIVYEHYVEAGLTRFSAVFYRQAPERVGSIRSARLIDANQLVSMYGALLAFSGASTGVEQIIYSADYASRTYKGVLYGSPYYWRDESIEAPHNMFLNVAALWSLASQEGLNTRPELGGMVFDANPPPNSVGVANNIDVRYSGTRVQWQYEPNSSVYMRFSDGTPHLDANTNAQIHAANVVVIYAPHADTDIVESVFQDVTSYSIDINLVGEGSAILFRDGQRYEGRWSRPTLNSRLTLITTEGQPLAFKPGNTWFQVVRPAEQMNPDTEWVRSE